MGLLSNRLDRESLKPGDHIYSWRTAYIYAHHGIYVGDEKVIHFTRRGTASVLDVLTVSSAPPPSVNPCPNCPHDDDTNGVIISCLDCFLAGGFLYRFEYSAPVHVVLADLHGCTCTRAASDPPETVLHRANHLLEVTDGFGRYNVFRNNCEDFAMYCKTGLLVSGHKSMGQSGQAASAINGSLTTGLSVMLSLMKINIYLKTASVATKVAGDCYSRYAYDLGVRSDVIEVPVEELTRRHDNSAP